MSLSYAYSHKIAEYECAALQGGARLLGTTAEEEAGKGIVFQQMAF